MAWTELTEEAVAPAGLTVLGDVLNEFGMEVGQSLLQTGQILQVGERVGVD